MRQARIGIRLLVLSLFAGSLTAAEVATVQASTLVITGMAPGSANKVQKVLETLPGVIQVKVNEEEGLAVVVYDPARVTTEEFTRAMQSASNLATFAKTGQRIVDGSASEEAVS